MLLDVCVLAVDVSLPLGCPMKAVKLLKPYRALELYTPLTYRWPRVFVQAGKWLQREVLQHSPGRCLAGRHIQGRGGPGHECGTRGAQQQQHGIRDVADVALQVGHHQVRVGGGAGAPQLNTEEGATANACSVCVWRGTQA